VIISGGFGGKNAWVKCPTQFASLLNRLEKKGKR